MNKQSFIDEHMKVCTTKPVKKYDPKKPVNATRVKGLVIHK